MELGLAVPLCVIDGEAVQLGEELELRVMLCVTLGVTVLDDEPD